MAYKDSPEEAGKVSAANLSSWPGPRTISLQRTENGFGFTLRHFIVYPPESLKDAKDCNSDLGEIGRQWPNLTKLEPMDTIFVKHVKEGGPAHRAGLSAGDRIVSVNGETITGKSYLQVVQLIQRSGNTLQLLVVPKEDDILQLYFSGTVYGSGDERRIPEQLGSMNSTLNRPSCNNVSCDFKSSSSSVFPLSEAQVNSYCPQEETSTTSGLFYERGSSEPIDTFNSDNYRSVFNMSEQLKNRGTQISQCSSDSAIYPHDHICQYTSNLASPLQIPLNTNSRAKMFGSSVSQDSGTDLDSSNNGKLFNNLQAFKFYSTSLDPEMQQYPKPADSDKHNLKYLYQNTCPTNSDLESASSNTSSQLSLERNDKINDTLMKKMKISLEKKEEFLFKPVSHSSTNVPSHSQKWFSSVGRATGKEYYSYLQKFSQASWSPKPCNSNSWVSNNSSPWQSADNNKKLSSNDQQMKQLSLSSENPFYKSLNSQKHFSSSSDSLTSYASMVNSQPYGIDNNKAFDNSSQRCGRSYISSLSHIQENIPSIKFNPGKDFYYKNQDLTVKNSAAISYPSKENAGATDKIYYHRRSVSDNQALDELWKSTYSSSSAIATSTPITSHFTHSRSRSDNYPLKEVGNVMTPENPGSPCVWPKENQHIMQLQLVSQRRMQFESGSIESESNNKKNLYKSELANLTSKGQTPSVSLRASLFERRSLSQDSNSDISRSTSLPDSNPECLATSTPEPPNEKHKSLSVEHIGNIHLPEIIIGRSEDMPVRKRAVRQNSYLAAVYSSGNSSFQDSVNRHSESITPPDSNTALLVRDLQENRKDVVLRKKAAHDENNQNSRRFSYMKATSNEEIPTSCEVDGKKQDYLFDANLTTPASNKSHRIQKLKAFFGEKTPQILEATERQLFREPTNLVIKDGWLHCKMVILDGKRASDRSWKQIWACLHRHALYLHKEKKDAHEFLSHPDDQLVILKPSRVDIASDYTKKKHVFRLFTSQGSIYLLQAEDNNDMSQWIQCLQEQLRSEENEFGLNSQQAILQKAAFSKDHISGLSPLPRAKGIKKLTSFRNRSPTGQMNAKNTKTSFGDDLSPKMKTWRGKMVKTIRRIHGSSSSVASLPVGININVPLEDCPSSSENDFVPLFLEICTSIVEARGLNMVGIYRVPGNTAAVSALLDAVNRGFDSLNLDDSRWNDVNVISSMMKAFFRKLPEPLITSDLYPLFIEANKIEDIKQRMHTIKTLLHELPDHHYETFKYLVKHLQRIVACSNVNKMEARNLAIVFGPTLVRAADNSMATMVTDMSHQCRIVETLINHGDWFFSDNPENMDAPLLIQQTNSSEANRSKQGLFHSQENGCNLSEADTSKNQEVSAKNIILSIMDAANKRIQGRVKRTGYRNLLSINREEVEERNIDQEVELRSHSLQMAKSSNLAASNSGLKYSTETSSTHQVCNPTVSSGHSSKNSEGFYSSSFKRDREFSTNQHLTAVDKLGDELVLKTYSGLTATTQERIRRFELETKALLQRNFSRQCSETERQLQRRHIEQEWHRAKQELEQEDPLDALADNPSTMAQHIAIPVSTLSDDQNEHPLYTNYEYDKVNYKDPSKAGFSDADEFMKLQTISAPAGNCNLQSKDTNNSNQWRKSSNVKSYAHIDLMYSKSFQEEDSEDKYIDVYPQKLTGSLTSVPDKYSCENSSSQNNLLSVRCGSLDSLRDYYDAKESLDDLPNDDTTTNSLVSEEKGNLRPSIGKLSANHGFRNSLSEMEKQTSSPVIMIKNDLTVKNKFEDVNVNKDPDLKYLKNKDSEVAVLTTKPDCSSSVSESCHSNYFLNMKPKNISHNSGIKDSEPFLLMDSKVPISNANIVQVYPMASDIKENKEKEGFSDKQESKSDFGRKNDGSQAGSSLNINTNFTVKPTPEKVLLQSTDSSNTVNECETKTEVKSQGLRVTDVNGKLSMPPQKRFRNFNLKRRHTVGSAKEFEQFRELLDNFLSSNKDTLRFSAWERLQPGNRDSSQGWEQRSMKSWLERERLRISSPNLSLKKWTTMETSTFGTDLNTKEHWNQHEKFPESQLSDFKSSKVITLESQV